MNINSRRSSAQFFVATSGLLLLLFAAYPHRAVAQQTNIFPDSGNAGVGTTSPNSVLTIQTTGTDNAGEKYLRIKSTNSYSGLLLDPGQAGDAGWLVLGGFPSAGDFSVREYGVANYLTIKKSTGNVGIGTTSPSERLHVAGGGLSVIRNEMSLWLANNSTGGETDWAQNAYYNSGWKYRLADEASRIQFWDGKTTFSSAAAGSANAALTWTDNVSILQNGSVGIGTMSPSQKVEAYNASGPTYFKATSGTVGTYLGTDGTNSYLQAVAANQKVFIANSAGTALLTADTGTGNVGIATATPNSNYKLDVNGNTNVTGNLNASGAITGGTINAKYQDVAEWVESSQKLPAGTVVVLDQTKSNQVIASSHAYDTRVAGVISAQPGITLGEGGESKVLVATTGRVKVKVDTTNGPIQVGDLLVTSDSAGLAKKSEPLLLGGVPIHRPGTLIGKALEPLAKGRGEILVLLSLQ
jgi:hypothetical protein